MKYNSAKYSFQSKTIWEENIKQTLGTVMHENIVLTVI